MPEPVDAYKVLQVDSEAEDEVIQAAYRRLARKYHPDLAEGAEAATRMAAINAAWELIGEPAARADYDRSRAVSPRPTETGVPPTALKARTGEFTPPGMRFCARAKSSSERVIPEG